ncbi:MAG: tyrosine-type recombinase/integrase [Bryobacteraceae bacterium]
MRRKRFQRGNITPRKRNGKNYWLAQWREDGIHRTKELGLCSKITRLNAEAMLQEILKPINEGIERRESAKFTFEQFVETAYLPVFERKWKSSTADTETPRIRFHLVRGLGDKLMRNITREDMQQLLDETAKNCGRSVVDHLRFRLRSIFELALSEGAVDRNPATTLFTPRQFKAGRVRKVLTPDQSQTMLRVFDLRERVIARLATWEGMRPGEILALQLGDVDGDCVWVRRRLYRANLDVPKNERSARQVALTNRTKLLLQAWLEASFLTRDAAWLFPSEKGTPLRRDNVWNRQMLPRLEPIGLGWATFQVMRRSFATWAKKAGVNAHTRSAQMGNTVDVNENEYAVASFEQKLAAVRLLETAVFNDGAESVQ